MPSRLAPAQKCLPAEHSTTLRTSGSSSRASRLAASSASRASSKKLLGGRHISTTATCSVVWTRIWPVISPVSCSGGVRQRQQRLLVYLVRLVGGQRFPLEMPAAGDRERGHGAAEGLGQAG